MAPSLTELGRSVSEIKKEYPYRKIWREIQKHPITIKSIDWLIKENWRVELDSIVSSCDSEGKLIRIKEDLNGYRRDRILFHEVVHAWYGDKLSDVWGAIFERNNRIITNWLAVQLRLDPELLRHTVVAFGLVPRIYDRISYMAFSNNPVDLDRQLIFPFAEEYVEQLKKISMDCQ